MAFKNLFFWSLIGIIGGFVLAILAKANIINPPICSLMGLVIIFAFIILGSLISEPKKITIPCIFFISGMILGAIGAEFALEISIFCIFLGLFYVFSPAN